MSAAVGSPVQTTPQDWLKSNQLEKLPKRENGKEIWVAKCEFHQDVLKHLQEQIKKAPSPIQAKVELYTLDKGLVYIFKAWFR